MRCVQTRFSPWWMNTEWGDQLKYCEECGFTTASLNCARREQEMRESKSRD